MPRGRRLVRSLLGLALVVLGLVATPLALGQGVVTSRVAPDLTDPARALQPGEEFEMDVHVTYQVGPGYQPEPDPENTQSLGKPTRFTASVKTAPSWVADARVEPAEVFLSLPIGRQGGEFAVEGFKLKFRVNDDAPAMVREPVAVTVTAEPNGNIQGSTGDSPEYRLKAAEVAKLNVTSDRGTVVVIDGGRWTTLPFTIRNEGNDATVVLLNVTLRPELSEVRLSAQQIDLPLGGTAVVTVDLRTPWTERETGTLELEATPLLDEEEGEPTKASVDIAGTSAVPGPGAGALLAAALVGLLARRARRS